MSDNLAMVLIAAIMVLGFVGTLWISFWADAQASKQIRNDDDH